MIRRALPLLAALAVLGAAPSVAAGAAGASSARLPERLDVAQEAFDRARELAERSPQAAREGFAEAADSFAALIEEGGGSAALWFNLGNAELRAGRLGAAIHAYRSGLALAPSDARLRANLAYARSLRRDVIEPAGFEAVLRPIVDARHLLPPGVRLWLLLAANALLWSLVGVRLLGFRVGPGWLAAAGVATALLAATLLADRLAARERAAVLVGEEIVLRTGSGRGFGAVLPQPLGPGVEVVVRESRPGWDLVRLPDGSEGWVDSDEVAMVGRLSRRE